MSFFAYQAHLDLQNYFSRSFQILKFQFPYNFIINYKNIQEFIYTSFHIPHLTYRRKNDILSKAYLKKAADYEKVKGFT